MVSSPFFPLLHYQFSLFISSGVAYFNAFIGRVALLQYFPHLTMSISKGIKVGHVIAASLYQCLLNEGRAFIGHSPPLTFI